MNDFDIAVYQQVNLHNRQETSFGPAEIEVSARCLKNVSVRATARTDISVHQFGTGTCYSKHLNYAILFGDQEEMQRRRQLRERTEYIVHVPRPTNPGPAFVNPQQTCRNETGWPAQPPPDPAPTKQQQAATEVQSSSISSSNEQGNLADRPPPK